MINNLTLADCFATLVGWRESARAGTCYEELTEALKTSTSGVYVNTIAPLVTLEVVNEIKTKDYETVNDYLESVHAAALIELMNDFVIKQKKEVYSKSLLKNGDIGTYAENMRKIVNKTSRFVGWEIIPRESTSIRAEILQFGGMFDTLQDELPIYFYSSMQMEPVGVYNVDITKQNSLEWYTITENTSGSETTTSALQFICDYINKNNGHGQRYYIGYYEADLTGNAIQTQMPCTNCSGNASKFEFHKYVQIRPIEVSAGHTYISSREIFDIDAVGVTTETYGLFLKLNVKCDVSQTICDNKDLFAVSYAKKIAIKILWDAYNSTNFNGTTSTKKADYRLMAEKLEQELLGTVIDNVRMKGELETLTIDFSNIDETCLGMKKNSFGLIQL